MRRGPLRGFGTARRLTPKHRRVGGSHPSREPERGSSLREAARSLTSSTNARRRQWRSYASISNDARCYPIRRDWRPRPPRSLLPCSPRCGALLEQGRFDPCEGETACEHERCIVCAGHRRGCAGTPPSPSDRGLSAPSPSMMSDSRTRRVDRHSATVPRRDRATPGRWTPSARATSVPLHRTPAAPIRPGDQHDITRPSLIA